MRDNYNTSGHSGPGNWALFPYTGFSVFKSNAETDPSKHPVSITKSYTMYYVEISIKGWGSCGRAGALVV